MYPVGIEERLRFTIKLSVETSEESTLKSTTKGNVRIFNGLCRAHLAPSCKPLRVLRLTFLRIIDRENGTMGNQPAGQHRCVTSYRMQGIGHWSETGEPKAAMEGYNSTCNLLGRHIPERNVD